jgi:SAM-dependent methyltransferase
VQPGVARLLTKYPPEGRWLDLGCGNGALGRELLTRKFKGEYVGVDSSPALLQAAVSAQGRWENNIKYMRADLSEPNWHWFLLPNFDVVSAFAVLHHIPGRELRLEVLRQVRNLLQPGGLFFHSEWQFQHSQRLVDRIQPWEMAGLSAASVDDGDALLDWRATGEVVGPPALRYVHVFTRPELAELAAAAGFTIQETFESDGQGSRLGLYQVWKLNQK